MSETIPEGRKPKKQRSPSYPYIDLQTALSRAEQLWEAEGRHFAPIPAIAQAWGYGPKSSGGLLTLAALLRFGLLEDQGATATREGRVTELARAIILDKREDSQERIQRIREAALTPTIHREIWDKYEGRLPSDATLHYHLTVERGFTPEGADEFIAEFKRTLEFAGLTAASVMVSRDEGDRDQKPAAPSLIITAPPAIPHFPPAPGRVEMTPSATAPPAIQFPVQGATVVIQSTAPLTDTAWDQMMAVLTTLKPAIVVASSEQAALMQTPHIQVGDAVDWESQGIVHGENLVVVGIEDGPDGVKYAHVEGSDTGIPLDQLTPVKG
jgi:hypothetical protein